MRKISFIFTLLLFVSCGKVKPKETEKSISTEEIKPYFDFDQIEHYQIDSKDETWKLILVRRSEISNEGKELLKLLSDHKYPSTLNDSIFLKNLSKLYPHKEEIPTNLFPEIKDVFSGERKGESEINACDTFFRDIFLFSRNGKIVGIAKICFECHHKYILGTNIRYGNFGANGEFEKLEKLVK